MDNLIIDRDKIMFQSRYKLVQRYVFRSMAGGQGRIQPRRADIRRNCRKYSGHFQERCKPHYRWNKLGDRSAF